MLIKNIGANAWVDINTISNIEVGKRFKVFNVSNFPVLLVTSSLEPNITSEEGVIAIPGRCIVVEAGNYSVWARTISGYQNAEVFVQETKPYSLTDNGLDPRVYTGLQGITTQPFVEANVKNGTQFEASSYLPSLPAGATVYTAFVTGSKPVLIKATDLEIDGAGITITLFKNPTYSGGVVTPSFNLNTESSILSESIVRAGVTVTSEGVQASATLTLIGSSRGGNNSIATDGTIGLDRVLEPNTPYLRKVTSIDTAAQKVSLYTTWYEGPLSTDLL